MLFLLYSATFFRRIGVENKIKVQTEGHDTTYTAHTLTGVDRRPPQARRLRGGVVFCVKYCVKNKILENNSIENNK